MSTFTLAIFVKGRRKMSCAFHPTFPAPRCNCIRISMKHLWGEAYVFSSRRLNLQVILLDTVFMHYFKFRYERYENTLKYYWRQKFKTIFQVTYCLYFSSAHIINCFIRKWILLYIWKWKNNIWKASF